MTRWRAERRVIAAALRWYRHGLDRQWDTTNWIRRHPICKLWTACALVTRKRKQDAALAARKRRKK